MTGDVFLPVPVRKGREERLASTRRRQYLLAILQLWRFSSPERHALARTHSKGPDSPLLGFPSGVGGRPRAGAAPKPTGAGGTSQPEAGGCCAAMERPLVLQLQVVMTTGPSAAPGGPPKAQLGRRGWGVPEKEGEGEEKQALRCRDGRNPSWAS